MEDGSQAEHVTGYYSNMTADCKDSTGQNVPMKLLPDPADGSRLICESVQQVACELVTTYKVGLRLHCVLVQVLLHITMQYLVGAEVVHCIAASSDRTFPFNWRLKHSFSSQQQTCIMHKLLYNCRSLLHICRWHQALACAWSKRLTSQSRAHLLWCLTSQPTLSQTGHASMSGHQCRGQSFLLLLSPCVTGIHPAQQQPNRLICVVLLVKPVLSLYALLV